MKQELDTEYLEMCREVKLLVSKHLLGMDPALKELYEFEAILFRTGKRAEEVATKRKHRGRPYQIPKEGRATSRLIQSDCRV
jgi:hypothetical protein